MWTNWLALSVNDVTDCVAGRGGYERRLTEAGVGLLRFVGYNNSGELAGLTGSSRSTFTRPAAPTWTPSPTGPGNHFIKIDCAAVVSAAVALAGDGGRWLPRLGALVVVEAAGHHRNPVTVDPLLAIGMRSTRAEAVLADFERLDLLVGRRTVLRDVTGRQRRDTGPTRKKAVDAVQHYDPVDDVAVAEFARVFGDRCKLEGQPVDPAVLRHDTVARALAVATIGVRVGRPDLGRTDLAAVRMLAEKMSPTIGRCEDPVAELTYRIVAMGEAVEASWR